MILVQTNLMISHSPGLCNSESPEPVLFFFYTYWFVVWPVVLFKHFFCLVRASICQQHDYLIALSTLVQGVIFSKLTREERKNVLKSDIQSDKLEKKSMLCFNRSTINTYMIICISNVSFTKNSCTRSSIKCTICHV